MDIENPEQPVQSCQLPNGLTIHHINKHETDFLYKEIFGERAYLKHGITLDSGACVFDVGANIGMFTLFVKQECPDATVHAVEPVPQIVKVLRFNASRFGENVKVYQNGMSSREGEASFTYYPDYSIMSGFHADASEDADVLSSGIRNQLANSKAKIKELPDELISSIVQNKLGKKSEFLCQLKTISGIVRESGIEKIDLLKIDAEKSEIAVLEGILENDWPKIKQIVLEVHSATDMESVRTLLALRRFKVTVEQEGQFSNSSVFNCFAVRSRD